MWQPRGRKGTVSIKTNPGRKRINILGALDLKNIRVISNLTENKCNTGKVVELFIKIKEMYPHKKIVIILDNAKYNHANNTRRFAKKMKIKLLFLPSYSPNLNLIERLWKFTKKKLVHNLYYEKFDLFVNEVEKYFENLDKYRPELIKIMNQQFEIIKLD